jgi:N-acyl-D-amino-acid deacylase
MAFDVLIRGGRIVDGTGAPWRAADVGIRQGKIARVGRIGRMKSDRMIDASGKYVAPGFIDIHTHSDIGILVEPTAECAVRLVNGTFAVDEARPTGAVAGRVLRHR